MLALPRSSRRVHLLINVISDGGTNGVDDSIRAEEIDAEQQRLGIEVPRCSNPDILFVRTHRPRSGYIMEIIIVRLFHWGTLHFPPSCSMRIRADNVHGLQ